MQISAKGMVRAITSAGRIAFDNATMITAITTKTGTMPGIRGASEIPHLPNSRGAFTLVHNAGLRPDEPESTAVGALQPVQTPDQRL